MTEEIKLREWLNARRFVPSPHSFKCPKCANSVLEDTWPPNYSTITSSGAFGTNVTMRSGSVKCVCKNCRISFIVSFSDRMENLSRTYEEWYSSSIPLVEKDGIWLTPHDVWREKYKDEHGEYPMEAYG